MKAPLLRALALVSFSTCIHAVMYAQAAVPAIASNGTVNAADYSRVLAPGATISIVGNNLATSMEAASALPLPTSLGGAMVEAIDGANVTALPLFFASPGQINAQLPYTLTGPDIQIRVTNSAGISNVDSVTIAARAPRLFSADDNGTSRPIVQDADAKLISKTNPLIAGGSYTVYVNSLGATVPAAAAGMAAGSGDNLEKIADPVSVSVNGKAASVTFAGLAPGLTGLYQVNFSAPYDHVSGDVPLSVSVGTAASQNDAAVPVVPNGFYFVLTGGKIVNGQNKTSLSGNFSPVAYRNEDQTSWGSNGYRMWSKQLEITNAVTDTAGLALTLMNGSTIVYDNNGLETKTQGNYYDNSFGTTTRIPDGSKAGLFEAYSMSNYLPAVFAGYFKIATPTVVTKMIGYFDGNGTPELRFNPADPNFKYRMNIFSNDPKGGDRPTETGSFNGDVFTSDGKGGSFVFSDTGVKRVFSDGASDPIYRMVYTLASPLTLAPGEYWFEHDAAVPNPFKLDLFSTPRFTTDSTQPGEKGVSKLTIARPKSLLSYTH